jgi:hypothetical protein
MAAANIEMATLERKAAWTIRFMDDDLVTTAVIYSIAVHADAVTKTVTCEHGSARLDHLET